MMTLHEIDELFPFVNGHTAADYFDALCRWQYEAFSLDRCSCVESTREKLVLFGWLTDEQAEVIDAVAFAEVCCS